MFQQDDPRYFIGKTIACEGQLVKLGGFSFARDQASGSVIRKNELRIKVFSLASPGFIVYQLPDSVDIEQVDIKSTEADAVLVQGNQQLMNLSERIHGGHF
jgi:hypothetical protein